MTLRGDETNDLTHPDRLQRELALAFARALHSHVCTICFQTCVCTVVGCQARKFPQMEYDWECFRCRDRHAATPVESAGDEVGGGDDEA